MINNANRLLKVFLCHASDDKPIVQGLYSRLLRNGVDVWLDKEKLLPGQNWQTEIRKAVRNSDIVIVCLSSHSVNKDGFVQKEIKIALDTADEKPEGAIFIIPARLENCVVPERISQFHWVDLFSNNGYELLLKSLRLRASDVGAIFEPNLAPQLSAISQHKQGSFENIWVNHNVYENSKKGMRMHFRFSIENHRNIRCRLVVYFEFNDGTKLKGYNNFYRTVSGHVAVGKDFEPRYDNSGYDDFDVFMPYDELNLATGNHQLRFYAALFNKDLDIVSSNYHYFVLG
jgi:hypothetical protein